MFDSSCVDHNNAVVIPGRLLEVKCAFFSWAFHSCARIQLMSDNYRRMLVRYSLDTEGISA